MDDVIAKARRALAWGVGMTSRRNKVLPAENPLAPIPARVGIGRPLKNKIAAIVQYCLLGPLSELSAWYYAAAARTFNMYSERLWHIKRAQPIACPDKFYTYHVTDAKKLMFVAGSPFVPVEMRLSSPTTPAAVETPVINAYQIIEGAYSTRTYHPLQAGYLATWPAITVILQRVKSLSFNLKNYAGETLGSPFTWTFSDDGEPTTSGTAQSCVNSNSAETGLSTRVHFLTAFGNINKLTQLIATKTNLITFQTPGGFLRGFEAPASETLTTKEIASATGGNATNLSEVKYIGQPWHGLLKNDGIHRTTAPLLVTPPQYQAQRGSTRYFKNPTAPGSPSAGDLPPGFAAAGMEFTNDIILAAATRYAPGANNGYNLLVSEWLHAGNDGITRRLQLMLTAATTLTTTWEIINYGPIHPFIGYLDAPVSIGSVTLTTTEPLVSAMFDAQPTTLRFETASKDQQTSTYNPPPSFNQLPTWPKFEVPQYFYVEASADGRKIALIRGWSGNGTTIDTANVQYWGNGTPLSCIMTVATLSIDGDLTVGTPLVEFQFVKGQALDSDLTVTITREFKYNDYTIYSNYNWDQHYEYTYITHYPDRIFTRCIAAGIKPDGELWKVLIQTRRYIDPANANNNGTAAYVYHTNVYGPDNPPPPQQYPDFSTTIAWPNTVNYNPIFNYTWTAGIRSQITITGCPIDLISLTMAYRVTNNVVFYQGTAINSGGSSYTARGLITPTAHYTLEAAFPTYNANNTYYCSYNPKTGELATSNTGTAGYGLVCWI